MNTSNKFHNLDNSTFKQLPNAIAIVDNKMRYIVASAKWLEEYGLEGMEIIGISHYDIFPEIGEEWKHIHQRCLQGEIIKNEEDKFIRANGTTQWLRWEIRPYKDSNGGIIGMIMFSEDITKRKRSDELNKEINVSSGIGGWDYNIIEDNLFWTSVTREIHEVEDDYVPEIKKAIGFFEEGGNGGKVNKEFEKAIKNGESLNNERQILTAKGNKRWIKYSANTEFINDKCIRIFGTSQDVTERRKLIEALHQSEAQFRGAFENAVIGMSLMSTEGKILEANQSLCNSLGYSKTELIKKTFQELTYPDDLEENLLLLNNLLSGKVRSYSMEKRFFHKKGEIIWAIISVSLVKDQNGNPSHLVSQIEDITERKKAEAEVRLLNEKILLQNTALESSNQELEQFAYVASHDMQEPLRMISAFLDLLQKKYNNVLDDKGKSYISYAIDGSLRMKQMITDILSYSTAGKGEYETEELDMNKIVKEIQFLLKSSIKESNTHLEINDLPVIKAAKIPMQQLFTNLITNSIKYQLAGNKPIIKINAVEKINFWEFSVCDNGIGIEKDNLEKVFTIFKRLHGKSIYSGSGIGLTICKKIVENHGGKIWIESDPGKGSTFYFTIKK